MIGVLILASILFLFLGELNERRKNNLRGEKIISLFLEGLKMQLTQNEALIVFEIINDERIVKKIIGVEFDFRIVKINEPLLSGKIYHINKFSANFSYQVFNRNKNSISIVLVKIGRKSII